MKTSLSRAVVATIVLAAGATAACSSKTSNGDPPQDAPQGGGSATGGEAAVGGGGGGLGQGGEGGEGSLLGPGCDVVEPEVLPGPWNGFCGDAGTTERFTDAEAFSAFYASCALSDTPPAIDFSTKEVWRIDDGFFSCPYEGSPQSLGFAACDDGALEEHVWWYASHCHCDYFDPMVAVVVVDAGQYQTARRVRHEEATCEETLCNCGGVELSCADPGFQAPCSPVPNGEDGMPPSWP